MKKLSTLQMNKSVFIYMLMKTHHIHTYTHGRAKLQPEQVNRDIQSNQNNKVHTARRIASTRCAALSLSVRHPDLGGGGGYPHPVARRQGGTPSSPGQSSTLSSSAWGLPHPVLIRGYPIQSSPGGYSHPVPDGATPS